MEHQAARLNPTSFAILSLLASAPRSAYELATHLRQQAWAIACPRTASRLYLEARRLADHGLVEASTHHRGRRARTEYCLTTAGREALQAWLDSSAGGLTTECEELLKLACPTSDLAALATQVHHDADTQAGAVSALLDSVVAGAASDTVALRQALLIDFRTRLIAGQRAWARMVTQLGAAGSTGALPAVVDGCRQRLDPAARHATPEPPRPAARSRPTPAPPAAPAPTPSRAPAWAPWL